MVNMLQKLMIGRLGNQMFQYATVRWYQVKYAKEEPISLNFGLVYKEGKKENGFYNQLTDFQITDCLIDQKIKLSFYQKFLFLKYILQYKIEKQFRKKDYELWKVEYERKLQKKYQKHGLFLFSFGYTPFSKTTAKNKLFVGHFESSKYFDEIKDVLQQDFTPKEKELEKNRKLYEQIRKNESVCVSIRRGDFLAKEHKKKHYICTPEYFEVAIKKMQKEIKNPQFVIFSDDISWVKKHIKFPKGTLFESGTDPVWEKLRLMYECKHFIISNSTFSWWAQYLSRNTNKKVIAPSRWQNEGIALDIYEDGWELIDVDSLNN